MDLLFQNISYEWNHTTCSLEHLFFHFGSCLQDHLCCPTCQFLFFFCLFGYATFSVSTFSTDIHLNCSQSLAVITSCAVCKHLHVHYCVCYLRYDPRNEFSELFSLSFWRINLWSSNFLWFSFFTGVLGKVMKLLFLGCLFLHLSAPSIPTLLFTWLFLIDWLFLRYHLHGNIAKHISKLFTHWMTLIIYT